jgi:hypothetical protein
VLLIFYSMTLADLDAPAPLLEPVVVGLADLLRRRKARQVMR